MPYCTWHIRLPLFGYLLYHARIIYVRIMHAFPHCTARTAKKAVENSDRKFARFFHNFVGGMVAQWLVC